MAKKVKEDVEYFNETVKTVLQKNGLFVNQNYLYHYTDIYGLEGIIKNKKLWLSERNYMNDINDELFIQNYISRQFVFNNLINNFYDSLDSTCFFHFSSC